MTERPERTPILLEVGDASFNGELVAPDASAVFWLDPPSGLGRQMPGSFQLTVISPEAVGELGSAITGAGGHATLVDAKSSTPCRAKLDDSTVVLTLDAASFRSWALAEGTLVYERYDHRWERRPD